MKTLEKTRAKNDWDTRKLEKRLKTRAKSQFRSESSPRKSRLLEKTRANWASQRSTKPNYAKSSRHSSENCRVHKKTREILKSKRNQKRTTDRHTGQINTARSTVLYCVRACVRACKQARQNNFPSWGGLAPISPPKPPITFFPDSFTGTQAAF